MILALLACCSLQTPTLPLCRQEITANLPLSPLARFGLGLAADGDWIAIGDPLTARGRVYLYEYEPVTDRHVHRLTITPTELNDFQFGWDLALDGDLLVIGSPSSLGAPVANPGSVYAYRVVGGAVAIRGAHRALDAGDDPAGRAVPGAELVRARARYGR